MPVIFQLHLCVCFCICVCVCWCCAANIEAKKMPQHFNFSCGNNNNLKVPLPQHVSWKQKQVSELSRKTAWKNLAQLDSALPQFGALWFITPPFPPACHALWPETKLHNQCKFGALNGRVEQDADITANNLDHGN